MNSIPNTPAQEKTSSWAIASLVASLIIFVPFNFAAGIVFGILALKEIKKSQGTISGKGLAITGITLSALYSLVILGLLAAMAIPAFNKVRENSQLIAINNEAFKISSSATQILLEYDRKKLDLEEFLLQGHYQLPEGTRLGSDKIFELDYGQFSLIDSKGNEYTFDSYGGLIEYPNTEQRVQLSQTTDY